MAVLEKVSSKSSQHDASAYHQPLGLRMDFKEIILWLGIIIMAIGLSCLVFLQVKITVGKSMVDGYSEMIWRELKDTEKKIALWGLKALAAGFLFMVASCFI